MACRSSSYRHLARALAPYCLLPFYSLLTLLQGDEGPLFCSYFGALAYAAGGSAACWRQHGGKPPPPRLLQVTPGDGCLGTVRRVPLSQLSLDEGGAFVLDSPPPRKAPAAALAAADTGAPPRGGGGTDSGPALGAAVVVAEDSRLERCKITMGGAVWRGEAGGGVTAGRADAGGAVRDAARDTLEIFQWHGEEVRARGMHGVCTAWPMRGIVFPWRGEETPCPAPAPPLPHPALASPPPHPHACTMHIP